jgi:AcrR family transcriptional regulator
MQRKTGKTARPETRAADRRVALRDALVNAAEKTIRTHGLAGLSARDLAREVGCALGAIYNVFPDLDAIVYAANGRTLAAIEAVIAGRRRRALAKRAGRNDAVAELVDLAETYLEFATKNQVRWRALFEHRRPTPIAAPGWYSAELRRLFAFVEEPLAALRPDLADQERQLLARTMFSAVHGVVSLGLEEKLVSVPVAKLKDQVSALVAALCRGMLRAPGARKTRRVR